MCQKFLRVLALTFATLLFSFPFSDSVRAQDINGDYFVTNIPLVDGPYFNSTWKVVSPKLECRSRAGTEF